MHVFVDIANLVFFQNNESAQREKFGYRTISGNVAILVKKK